MSITLSYLSLFQAVAQAKSITLAAEAVGVSQPAVSKQIKLLERELGLPVIERVGRGIRLTPAGDLLAEYARRIFALVGEAEEALNDLQGLRRGRLAIGAGTMVGVYLLPDAIVRFRQRFPNISFSLDVASSHLLRNRLRDGSLEFAILEGPLTSPEFSNTVCMLDELVGIVSTKHRLGQLKSMSAKQFACEPFVVREVQSGTRSLVERVFAERGLRVKPILALSSTEAVKRAVAAGLGVSIISKMSIGSEVEAGKLVAIKLRDVLLRRPIYVVRREDRRESHAATAFLCLLKPVIRGTLPPVRSRH